MVQPQLKIELPYDTAISLLGIYPKDWGLNVGGGVGRAGESDMGKWEQL